MRRDPFEEIRRLEERTNELFRDFWGWGPGHELPPWAGERRMLPGGQEKGIMPYAGEPGARMPASEIVETDKEVIVTAEVPGVEKGEISINATEDSLEISAEKRQEKKEEKKGYFMQERHYGRFYRSLRLPAAVDPSKARAAYNNGVLEVRLPKVESTKRKGIKVE